MPKTSKIVSQITIKLKGNELDHALTAQLVSVSVDQHAYLPAAFTIQFHDSDLQILDQGTFNLTDEVEILCESDDGQQVRLIKGEVVALEPIFGQDMIADLIITGFDKLHRLYREPHTRAFLNTKDSDIAEQFARDSNLNPQVETTAAVYDHIFQNTQSDLTFLQQRADRIGFECFADDGKLYFRKPQQPQVQMTLTWGEDLLTFRPRLSLAEQVEEVIVHGWDVKKKEAIIGRATQANLRPEVSEKASTDWTRPFGSGKKILVDQPVGNQREADLLADARLQEASGAFIVAHGTAFRKPQIKAGQWIRLEGLGERLTGNYLVTHAVHTHSAEGLITEFHVTGAKKGTISDTLHPNAKQNRLPGAIPAIVTNNQDPNKLGRVKVKYPGISDDTESHWARVISPGAGDKYGFSLIPEVGDEVMVIFGNGVINHPYILGGVWNGKTELPPAVKSASENHKIKAWQTPGGHSIVFYDDNNKKIEILTNDGRKITLDDSNKKISIETSSCKIELEDQNLTIKAGGKIEIDASNIKLKANGNIEIDASGEVKINGAIIRLN